MKTKYFETITDYLGKEEERYFSCGFKFFDIQYQNLYYQNKCLTGNLKVDFNWENKKNRHHHLGSVEYIAIACTICEQILLSEFHLSTKEIASSWFSHFKTKIKSCIDISSFDNTIEISGQLISTNKIESSTNKYKSFFEIKIGNNRIEVEINHPIFIWFKNLSENFPVVNESNVYYAGYKKRNHSIQKVLIEEECEKCSASIFIKEIDGNKTGIGSLYDGILLTDVLLITGQLLQALFFSIEKIGRKTANNIWLKELSISMPEPSRQTQFNAKMNYSEVKTLKKDNGIWKSVRFKSKLDNIEANIKMVSQIN